MKTHISDALLAKYQSTNSLQNTNQFIRDTRLVGFGARASSYSVSFIVETKNRLNKTIRRTIGHFPLLSIAEARERALDTLKELKLGHTTDPELRIVSERYLGDMSHRRRTAEDYRNIYSIYLDDWSSIEISAITREMVVEKYTSSCSRSVSQANKAMRYLSAVWKKTGSVTNERHQH
jgi:hypothetical protein